MHYNFLLILIALCFLGCTEEKTSGWNEDSDPDSVVAIPELVIDTIPPSPLEISSNELFTIDDAEKILGEKCHLKDSSTSVIDGVLTFKSTFEGDITQNGYNRAGVVYFMFEEYKYGAAAHKVYEEIKTSNEKNGIKTLSGFGDEAYFHSDFENFYFFLGRKGPRMIRVKVNKITSTTQKDNFMVVCKTIVDFL